MSPRLIIVVAVIAGLVAVGLVYQQIQNIKGETITVYKSSVDLAAGEILGDQVEEVTLPGGLFPSLFREAPTSDMVALVQTTPLRESVRAGEILLFRHFDSAVEAEIHEQIPPGMKAISIPVDQITAVSYFIQPGDYVDVMATFLGADLQEGVQANPGLYQVSTRPVAQAVKVLAVGGDQRPSQRQVNNPYSSVTLLVSMQEAAKLIFARDFFGANMTLVLRNQDDLQVDMNVSGVGVDTAEFDMIGNQPRN